MRSGFTVIEVVVALVVLEVGLLGTMGILTEASRVSRRAATLELGIAALEGVADSLLAVGWGGDGGLSMDEGELQWVTTPDSRVVIGLEPVVDKREEIRISLSASTFR
jgi:hypothetical protein